MEDGVGGWWSDLGSGASLLYTIAWMFSSLCFTKNNPATSVFHA